MALKPGTQLGPYEITAPLGAGGMGEVYRATDTKLKREVAIKVLPDEFSADADRLTRFEREAKVLASLNHPAIATLYGFEDGFLVMELVEGETLAERIAKGPIPADEAIPLFVEIAEGLEAAHDKGVVHRDLKPANLKIGLDGKPKILDFGLAKAFAGHEEDVSAETSQSPTLTKGTALGTIMGTASYMSPEQARGKTVDKRTDIWAFGCLLYEALTARQVFQGETITDILGALLHKEPDWDVLPEDIPPTIGNLLRRCLRKDRNRRLQHIGDARIEMEDALTGAGMEIPAAAPKIAAHSFWRRAIPWAGTGLVVGAVLASLAVWNLKFTSSPESRPITRLSLTLPSEQGLTALDNPAIVLSPDGIQLVYVSRNKDGNQQLYLRPMDSLESRPIPGTEGAVNPFFSPDGQWVGFWADKKLKKVSIGGGGPLTLCELPMSLAGASWGIEDEIVFATTRLSGIWKVAAAGGTPELLTSPDFTKGESGHFYPEFLPDGKAVIFNSIQPSGAYGVGRILVRQLETGEQRVLIEAGGTNPHYAPTGHLIYTRAGNLLAAPFDPVRLEVTGSPVSIGGDIMQSAFVGAAQLSFSRQGSLVYVAGGMRGAEYTLVLVDRKGEAEVLTETQRSFESPRVSPDGKRVAVTIRDPNTDVWVLEIERGTLSPFTSAAGEDETPIWSTDGRRLTFSSSRAKDSRTVSWQAADRSGAEETLLTLTSEQHVHLGSWSPDGTVLAFVKILPETDEDIWVFELGSESEPRPFFETEFKEATPMFSPDGRWLAYSSNESGRFEIHVQAFPGPGGRQQVSSEGGEEPVWAPTGRELFYRNGDRMMVVEITTEPSFSLGTPRLLFEKQYVRTPWPLTNYDVTPEGQRFVMVKASEQQLATGQIHVVLNWFEELRRLVPRD